MYDNFSDLIVTERKLLLSEVDSQRLNLELSFSIKIEHQYEFRVWWYGHCDLVVESMHLRENSA